MDETKNKFNSLTPELLDNNEEVYDEALDFAFSKNSIRNIAITGIYGAGKSTVWNTYVKKKKLQDIINVSLGEYKDDKVENDKCDYLKKETQNINKNRIERQLINQMVSQINSSKIPLSKYNFKNNKSNNYLYKQTVLILCFISSVIFWLQKDLIVKDLLNIFTFINQNYINFVYYFICAICFFYPLYVFFKYMVKGNKLKLSKLNVKGAEAIIGEDKDDETIFDRDIKEIVYLLNSSGTEIVVFEDLDRYDDVDIFTKLRELNFLLNSYKNTNENEKIVRFVYMVKDDLFVSKNRTKFFDFILPIVPIIDSNTSENELIRLLSGISNKPSDNLIFQISLYIDDMRLLKNIVNEFTIYLNIIPMTEYKLTSDKLFSIITLKNIFPSEFDCLEKRKGYIINVFNRIDEYRLNLKNEFKSDLLKLEEKIKEIHDRIEDNKFEAMTLLIPSNVRNYNDNIPWPQTLKKWSKQRRETKYIEYNSSSGGNFTYEEFFNRFINDAENNSLKIIDKNQELNELNSKIGTLNEKINQVDSYKYKDIISEMKPEKINDIFICDKESLRDKQYIPLIRFMIVEGLLDETYWYYMGNFNLNDAKVFERNDTIYYKSLLEGKETDILLNIENPKNIVNHLTDEDFKRFNILNKNILQFCIQFDLNDLMKIVSTIKQYVLFNKLAKIIETYDFELTNKFANQLISCNEFEFLSRILEESKIGYAIAFKNLLISIYIYNNIESSKLELFNEYIEPNENIIELIEKDKFNLFIINLQKANTKFDNLLDSDINYNRMIEIERIHAYDLNVENVEYIVRCLTNSTVEYGKLISDIFELDILIETKNYIERNFVYFIRQYIDLKPKQCESFFNSESVLITIIQSELEECLKCKYIDNNTTKITNLTNLQCDIVSKEVFECLLDNDTILFTKNNLTTYWNFIDDYSEKFVNYLERNISYENEDDILENSADICNRLINDSNINDQLFNSVLNHLKKPVEKLNDKLPKTRVSLLINRNFLVVNEDNINTLYRNHFYDEIKHLVNNSNEDNETKIINYLLAYGLVDELAYMLINADITDDNACRLIDFLGDKIEIQSINRGNKYAIEKILDCYLTNDNIKCICSIFDTFILKDKFINILEDRGILASLDNDCYNNCFVERILETNYVSLDTKINLILKKIDEHASIIILQKYISMVEEISELAQVWNHKYPKIDNEYKKTIRSSLIRNNYVKHIVVRNINRIKVLKK